MTIAMPAQDVPINEFVGSLTPDSWTALATRTTPWSFDVYLPKYRLTWQHTLTADLQALGMRHAFAAGDADFTRLSRTKGRELYISEVKQKTFVDVNEEGTEAAAVTTVGDATPLSMSPSIRVDRPFVFAIRERLSGTVLFMGKVVRP